MNALLQKVVQRELSKIDKLSESDGGILPQAHLDALESLAKIMKGAPSEDEAPPMETSPEALAAALKLAGG